MRLRVPNDPRTRYLVACSGALGVSSSDDDAMSGRTSSARMAWGDIVIHSMPSGGRAIKMDRAVQIDGRSVFIDAQGKLYCPSVKPGLAYPLSEWNWTRGMLKGLIALDVITAKQMEDHLSTVEVRAKQRDAAMELEYIDKIFAKYGAKLSMAQRAKFVKAMP